MHIADEQGNTKYDLLTKFSERTGKQHPDLIQPEMDDSVIYVWNWFIELNAQRTGTGFGANPIQFVDIQAWAYLTGRKPTPWEIKSLRKLDQVWLAELSKIRDSQNSSKKIK